MASTTRLGYNSVGRFTAISAAALISSALAGWLASTVLRGLRVVLLGMVFGPVDTILMGTGLLICAGGCYAMMRLKEG